MNNNELANILEKLLDELEYHCTFEAKPKELNDTIDYCSNVRKQVFTGESGNPLTFQVIDSKQVIHVIPTNISCGMLFLPYIYNNGYDVYEWTSEKLTLDELKSKYNDESYTLILA